ncbi:hypothetical protein M0813_22516 [Anaeramoeba flamelloides]|uniref:Vitellogenin domain-containing protein n=1 Tax=Anaeramoeba flamelloides TaxID=1746091 RepID=A0ABQ8YCS1_9EUKA|nr:hypothetical protein M0813_22516 [Anaeramoeba flamelloides]
MKLFLIVLLALLSTLINTYPTQLNYVVGHQYEYITKGTLDARGHEVTSGTTTYGVKGNMNSIFATKCIDEDSEKYLFICNMFDTQVGVNQGDSATMQPLHSHVTAEGDSPLGYDMYYEHYKTTGKLGKIYYNTADSASLVEIKVGAISSMQTYLTHPQQKQTQMLDDPLGSYDAVFYGYNAADSALTIKKNFNQNNVKTFSDPKVVKNTVQVQGSTNTMIHKYGHIQTSSVDQLVVFKKNSAGEEQSGELDASKIGLDSDIGSHGVLNMNLQGIYGVEHAERKGLSTTHSTFQHLKDSEEHVESSLFGFSRARATRAPTLEEDFEGYNANSEILKLNELTASNEFIKYSNEIIKIADKLVQYYNLKPQDLEADLVPSLIKNSHEGNAMITTLFYILSTSELKTAQRLIISYGLKSETESVRDIAIMACHNVKSPISELLYALKKLYVSENNHNALAAMGTTIENIEDQEVRQEASNFLISQLYYSLSKTTKDQDEHMIASIINGMSNAGEGSISLMDLPLDQLTAHPHYKVRRAIADYFELVHHHSEDKSSSAFAQIFLEDMLAKEENWHLKRQIGRFLGKSLSIENSDPNFPFNKDWKYDKIMGGKEVGAEFSMEFFIGTNFDCNQKYFNYKVMGNIELDLLLFGMVNVPGLQAHGEYGRQNGAKLLDEFFLKVFTKVVWQKPIPSLDCVEHTYPIAHTAPALDLSYTVFVSIIPITFYIKATLTLDLSWGWKICDDTLLAMIELIPAAGLTISGGAEINLFILKAGVELVGGLNGDLRPQGYIHGSECTIGFDLDFTSNPFNIKMDAYFEWKKCKFLIFDCHWGKHNEYDFFNWAEPSHNDIIYNVDYKIAK